MVLKTFFKIFYNFCGELWGIFVHLQKFDAKTLCIAQNDGALWRQKPFRYD